MTEPRLMLTVMNHMQEGWQKRPGHEQGHETRKARSGRRYDISGQRSRCAWKANGHREASPACGPACSAHHARADRASTAGGRPQGSDQAALTFDALLLSEIDPGQARHVAPWPTSWCRGLHGAGVATMTRLARDGSVGTHGGRMLAPYRWYVNEPVVRP